MENITYRAPRPEEAEAIVAFYNAVGGETSYLSFEKDEYPLDVPAQKQAILALEGDPINAMVLAMAGGEIAGIATISSSHKIKSRHNGELGIVVAGKYQGRGIGTELIRRLVDWARGNGVTTKLSLRTRADNVAAVQLYLRLGFTFEGCLKGDTLLNGQYYDTYWMGMML